MTETPTPDGKRKPETRALNLAKDRYELRRATRWPYALRGEHRWRFDGPERRQLLADLRNAWRSRYENEEPPGDRILGRVLDDLRQIAMEKEPDPLPIDLAAQMLDAAGLGPVSEDRGLELVTGYPGCPLPPDYVVPQPYAVTEDGIHNIREDGASVRVTWAWLFPVAVYADPDGDQLVELAWRDDRHWVRRLVRRAITKSGRKLITEVGDAGLPVTEAEARQAERWLAAAESANRAAILRHPVARQLGWQADGRTFVTGQDTPWRVEPRYAEQAGALEAHRCFGTLAGWQQAIEAARNYPVVQAGLYAGLAAPLLVPLGLDSFTADFAGKSSRGKSITAMVALSCWADPSDRGDGMFSWQTTVIAAEKRLNLVNGLPVVLDETRLVKDPAIVDTIIYEIPKNHGKPRGGGWPNLVPWRTIVVSTGEQPATSFTSHQGASARVLSVQSPPFGPESPESRAAAEAVKSGVEANYGTAGPAFVRRLQARLAEDGGVGKLRARHAELTELLRGGTDMTGRRAPLLACMALAAELAAEWGIAPFAAPDTAAWLSLFSAPDQRDNRPEMALDIVREYIGAHAGKLWSTVQRSAEEHAPAAGWIGRDLEPGESREAPDGGVALLPGRVAEELKRRGYDLDAVLPGWRERGTLAERKGQEPPYKIPVRIDGRPVKCLVFPMKHLEDAGGGER